MNFKHVFGSILILLVSLLACDLDVTALDVNGVAVNQPINNGDTYDIGDGIVTLDTITTFEAVNNNFFDVTVTGITLTGDATGDLCIYPSPSPGLPATLGQGDSLTFGISFAPDAVQGYSATVTITTSTLDPFVFDITAQGVPYPGFDLTFSGTPNTILEDAVIISSVGGGLPREAHVLGDVDLSVAAHSFNELRNTAITDWWIIGHIGSEVVYTSNQALTGVDLFAVDPYALVNLYDFNIPNQLDAYANGNPFTIDWWVITILNHSLHVATDNNSATLYQFNTSGTAIGTVTVDMR
jgi:hypothetical protein